jgi:TPR repeat protein|tara:strand:+ start:2515 stop:2826 length:312 start_codon:yes stop_codon:yes gene_type:complete
MISIKNKSSATDRSFKKAVIFYKKQEYKKAMTIWLQLAKDNELDAQFNLGVMYFKGEGVIRNYEEAAKWYRKAALQGRKIIKQKNKELKSALKSSRFNPKSTK